MDAWISDGEEERKRKKKSSFLFLNYRLFRRLLFPMFDFKELKSDRSLILAICKKDQESFSVLYHRYRPLLFAVSFRLSHSREDSEDVLQDAFLALWNNPEQVDPDKNIRSFLCSCVANRTENLLKKRNQASYQDYESLISLVGKSDDSDYLMMLDAIRAALAKKRIRLFCPS
jgi:DNA-directed RNA polymerase specialized sigma24 family protein